jgi:predicted transposase YdaD
MQRDEIPDFAGGVEAAHDALFRFVFSRAECAVGELQSVLPAEVAGKLDFASLRLARGRGRRQPPCQLVFSVRLSGRDAFVLMRFERDGARASGAPLRMLGALQRFWHRHVCVHPGRPLPLILPVLVLQGERRSRGAESLCDMFEVDLATWVALAPLIPDFTLALDDLAALGGAALRARSRLPVLGRLALFLLQRARRAPDLALELAEWREPLAALLGELRGGEQLSVLLEFVFWVADVSLERLRQPLQRTNPRAEEIMVTTAERLIARGRAEGELAGRARGELLGRAATLLTLLTRRFGELSPHHHQRIRAASSLQLERWTERLLDVSSLAELFD